MRCPTCNGDGGVMLLMSIAPCDRCLARGREAKPADMPTSVRWISYDYVLGSMPPIGMIAWDGENGHDSCQHRDKKVVELIEQGPFCLRTQGSKYVFVDFNDAQFGTKFLLTAEQWDDHATIHRYCLMESF